MPDRPPAPDPAADWWMMNDVAAWLGVKYATVRRYRASTQLGVNLPPADRMFGRTPAWKPATIITWNDTGRPGQGRRAAVTSDG